MIDETIKNKLSSYFATQPVEAVYLFGSQALGKARKDSDIDLAVLFNKTVSEEKRGRYIIEMTADLEGIISGKKLDIINLSKAPIALQYSAVYRRHEILVKNSTNKALFEAQVFSRYFDYSYYI